MSPKPFNLENLAALLAASSVTVVSNALRLRTFRPPRTSPTAPSAGLRTAPQPT